MSHLDVMISMDSSNMHLASLTGTPVVSVWGATHPYAGCRRGDYACMNNISPKTIVEKVEHILSIK